MRCKQPPHWKQPPDGEAVGHIGGDARLAKSGTDHTYDRAAIRIGEHDEAPPCRVLGQVAEVQDQALEAGRIQTSRIGPAAGRCCADSTSVRTDCPALCQFQGDL